MAVLLLVVESGCASVASSPTSNDVAVITPPGLVPKVQSLDVVAPAPPPVPAQLQVTFGCDTQTTTNQFVILETGESQTVATNEATFTDLSPGVIYHAQATAIGDDGQQATDPSELEFILPVNTLFATFDGTNLTVTGFATLPGTFQSSPDLVNWSDIAALGTNSVNTISTPANQPAQYFRFNQNQ